MIQNGLTAFKNTDEVVLPSLSRAAATYTSDPISNPGANALHCVISVTDKGASGTLQVTINGKDANGITYPLIASASIAANSVVVLRVGPGLTASANVTVNDIVPATIQVVSVVGTNAVVFSIALSLVD